MKRPRGTGREMPDQVLAQIGQGGMDALDDRPPAGFPVFEGEHLEAVLGQPLEAGLLLEEAPEIAAIVPGVVLPEVVGRGRLVRERNRYDVEVLSHSDVGSLLRLRSL